ncbi:MAG: tyrosine-type recombinase/integrase [Bacteroidales bacterium]
MNKIKIIQDKRRILNDNTYPLKLSINIQSKGRILINTGISILADNFSNGSIIGHPKKDILNNLIKFKVNKIDDILIKLTLNGEIQNLSLTQIKELIKEDIETSPKETSILFIDYFNQFLSFKTKKATIDTYINTLRKIEKYNSIKKLKFEDITHLWLKEFEHQLKIEGLSINSISIHLRNIRTLFNSAIDEDIISQNFYPFRKFSIKNEQTEKRALNIDELIKFKNHICEPHQVFYQDMFMLIFYLIGINIIDLYNLEKTNLRNNRLVYRRAKTNQLYNIYVHNEAMDIINKYKGSNNRLLLIADKYKNHKDFTKRLNINLKQIGETSIYKHGKKERKPFFPELSSYWARHTWATLASELDISEDIISNALGHSTGNKVTQIYIDFNTKKVDTANRKIIDFVNEKSLTK